MKKLWIIVSGVLVGLIAFLVTSLLSQDVTYGGGSHFGYPLLIFSSPDPMFDPKTTYYFLNIVLDILIWIVPAILLVWAISKLFGSKNK